MAIPMNFLPLFLFIFFPSTNGALNILDFGAKADGATDSTKSLLNAWASACGSLTPESIHIPSGKFLINQVTFEGPCKNHGISIWIDGTLIAPSNYESIGTSGHWLVFNNVQGVSIYGGTLDGQGTGLWACKAAGKNCPDGAASLSFNGAKDILISGLTSVNSQLYHLVIDGSSNVKVQGVKIMAPGNSPNTDGIHVQQSTGVTITSTGIKTGDDCISVGPGTMNLWIENIACGPGHGISIGSLGRGLQEQGVQNITVKTAVFRGTQNGLRIKTWGRPSDGFVKGVVFQNALMYNVQNPIIIDQNYCPDDKGCPNQNSGVKISDVTYRDIQGTSATEVAVKLDCSKSNPCNKIGLEDIKLTYGNNPAQSSCQNAGGTVNGFIVPPSCL
ncbi:polygalacturonase-like [Tasmannia lanceolata]|uniref:polygalacturonase-like n=1 Tax=Tasmannia lanceolata TaxID=3420 RepID=UPI0040630BFC